MSIFKKRKKHAITSESVVDDTISHLAQLQALNNAFMLKIYFVDKDNYTIKCISENEELIKVYRKTQNKKLHEFDLKK